MTIVIRITSGKILADPRVVLHVVRSQIAVLVGIQSVEVRTPPCSGLHAAFVWTRQIVPGGLILASGRWR